MVVFSLLYRASVKKYRGVLREQAQREFSVKSIEDDYETMDWCNYFLEQFWYYLNHLFLKLLVNKSILFWQALQHQHLLNRYGLIVLLWGQSLLVLIQ